MSQPEAPNPERRSNNAILCFCIGSGFLGLSWFLGLGTALAGLGSGDAGVAFAGGVAGAVAMFLSLGLGFVLTGVGAVWIAVRVIADQAGDKDEQRYRKVER